MRQAVMQLFEQADVDRSGVMDKAEFEALVSRMNEDSTLARNLFKGLDTDRAWDTMAKVPIREGTEMGVSIREFVRMTDVAFCVVPQLAYRPLTQRSAWCVTAGEMVARRGRHS